MNRVLDKGLKSTTFSSIEIDGKTLTKERDVLEALDCHLYMLDQSRKKHRNETNK